MSIKKHIPNLLTLANLTCGCLAIIQIFAGHLEAGAYFIWLAMLLDFFDGFAARLLRVSSNIGKELDSLADMVSFGVAPAMIIFQIVEGDFRYIAMSIAIFSALRLARFNTDENQSDKFIGLPTPANALLISALPFFLESDFWSGVLSSGVLVVLTIILSFLLVSPIELFSLKMKSAKLQDNKIQVIFIVISIVIVAFMKLLALPFIIIWYILLSIVNNWQIKLPKQ